MSSRRALDAQGHPIVIVTTPGEPPRRYRVVGDQVAAAGTEITFTGAKTGRRLKQTSRAWTIPTASGRIHPG